MIHDYNYTYSLWNVKVFINKRIGIIHNFSFRLTLPSNQKHHTAVEQKQVGYVPNKALYILSTTDREHHCLLAFTFFVDFELNICFNNHFFFCSPSMFQIIKRKFSGISKHARDLIVLDYCELLCIENVH